MDDDLCVRWGESSGVVVELSMHLCIPRNFWVHARLSEQVERKNSVWDKSAPEMKQDVLVSAGTSHYEVLLESPDSSFC